MTAAPEDSESLAYVFAGRIFPERCAVWLAKRGGSFRASDSSWEGTLEFQVSLSQVVCVLKVKSEVSDLRKMKTSLQWLIQNEVNALIYLSGNAYDVELTTCLRPDGEMVVFGVGVDAITQSESERPFDLEKVLELAHKHRPVTLALADLRRALQEPVDTHLACFRAIESMRQHFADGVTVAQSWETMRTALRFERSYIKLFEDKAIARRHGELPFSAIDGAERETMLLRTWKLFDRFLLHLFGASLDEAETLQ